MHRFAAIVWSFRTSGSQCLDLSDCALDIVAYRCVHSRRGKTPISMSWDTRRNSGSSLFRMVSGLNRNDTQGSY